MSAEPYDLDTSDPTFVEDLQVSRASVEAVARWFSRREHIVVIHPTFVRPSAAERAGYADGGDLGVMQRVEVKQRRNLTFTSKADYPYPTVFLDSRPRFDKKRPRPYAYMIVNSSETAGLYVNVPLTREHWVVERVFDKGKSRWADNYAVALEHVQDARLDEA